MTTIARQSQFHATLAPSMPPNPIVVFDTSKGTFKAELFLDKTPVTASNIVDLARNGFYDGLHFHRVIEGFMLVRASRRPVVDRCRDAGRCFRREEDARCPSIARDEDD